MSEQRTKENHCQACEEGYPKDDGMHRGNLGTFACPRDRAAHEPIAKDEMPLLMRMLTEARCPYQDCDNHGQRLVKTVGNWFTQKECEWCTSRREIVHRVSSPERQS